MVINVNLLYIIRLFINIFYKKNTLIDNVIIIIIMTFFSELRDGVGINFTNYKLIYEIYNNLKLDFYWINLTISLIIMVFGEINKLNSKIGIEDIKK